MKRFWLPLLTTVVLFALLAACGDDTQQNDGNAEVSEVGRGMLAQLGSVLAVNNALSNFGEELGERLETTPFRVFPMLVESIQHGTTHVNFLYSDEWMDWQGNAFDSRIAMDVTLVSDSSNSNFRLFGDIDFGESFDFSAYLDNERLAIRSDLLGEDYYGVVFATFAQDLARMTEEIGLDFGVAEIIESMMGSFESIGSGASQSNDEYLRLFFDFMRNAEETPVDVDINTARGTVTARRVSYVITMQDLAGFLGNFLSLMEQDGSLSGIFGNPLQSATMGVSPYVFENTAIAEIRYLISLLEQSGGDISVAFYIGARDRLLRVTADATFTVERQPVRLALQLDLGENATDIWRIEMNATSGITTNSIHIAWDMNQNSGRYVHTITMSIFERGFTETVVISSDWNPTSGDFVLSYGFDGHSEEFLRGNFIATGDTFRFQTRISEEDWHGNRTEFILEISTESDANIGNVEFVNIGDFSFVELEALVNAIASMNLIGNMHGDFDFDWDDFDWGDLDWDDLVWDNIVWAE